jgi:hypothetical protein
MYGFGDVPNPAADSIAVMDDLVIDYITDMVIVSLSQTPLYTKTKHEFIFSATKLQVWQVTETRSWWKISSLC